MNPDETSMKFNEQQSFNDQTVPPEGTHIQNQVTLSSPEDFVDVKRNGQSKIIDTSLFDNIQTKQSLNSSPIQELSEPCNNKICNSLDEQNEESKQNNECILDDELESYILIIKDKCKQTDTSSNDKVVSSEDTCTPNQAANSSSEELVDNQKNDQNQIEDSSLVETTKAKQFVMSQIVEEINDSCSNKNCERNGEQNQELQSDPQNFQNDKIESHSFIIQEKSQQTEFNLELNEQQQFNDKASISEGTNKLALPTMSQYENYVDVIKNKKSLIKDSSLQDTIQTQQFNRSQAVQEINNSCTDKKNETFDEQNEEFQQNQQKFQKDKIENTIFQNQEECLQAVKNLQTESKVNDQVVDNYRSQPEQKHFETNQIHKNLKLNYELDIPQNEQDNFNKNSVEDNSYQKITIECHLENILEQCQKTKQNFQKRSDQKKNLLEKLQQQLKSGQFDFNILKKWIAKEEQQKFETEMNNYFDHSSNKEQQQDIDRISKQPTMIQDVFPLSTQFFQKVIGNQNKIDELINIMKNETNSTNNSNTQEGYILIQDQISFIQELNQSRNSKELSIIMEHFQQLECRDKHPFYFILNLKHILAQIKNYIEKQCQIKLQDSQEFISYLSLQNKFEEFLNNISDNEKLEQEHEEYFSNIDYFDFLDFVENLGKDNHFNQLITQKQNQEELIQSKLEEEQERPRYIDGVQKFQRHQSITTRLVGRQPNQLSKNFMSCMYSLTMDDIKKQINRFDTESDPQTDFLKDSGIINILMPYIQTQLKQFRNFEEIFSEIFCDNPIRPEYQLNQKIFIQYCLEKFKNKNIETQNIIQNYNKFTKPYSFIYSQVDENNNKLVDILNLNSFRYNLSKNNPFVVFLSDGKVGQSTLINHIYNTSFYMRRHQMFSDDVDIFFNCPQLNIGVNLIDIHGNCLLKKQKLQILFSILRYFGYFVVVQSFSFENLLKMKSMLQQEYKVNDNKMLLIQKDTPYQKEEVENKQSQVQLSKFVQISQYQNSISEDTYARDLTNLRRIIKEIVGFGRQVKKSIKHEQAIQNYWDMAQKLNETNYQNIIIRADLRLQDISLLMMRIIQAIYNNSQSMMYDEINQLRDLLSLPKKRTENAVNSVYKERYKDTQTIKNKIFINLTVMDEVSELQIQKLKLGCSSEFNNYIKINKITTQIQELREFLSSLGIHPLVEFFIDSLSNDKNEELNEFFILVDIISQPIIKPLEEKLLETSNILQSLTQQLSILEQKYWEIAKKRSDINSDQIEDFVKREAQNDPEIKNLQDSVKEKQKEFEVQMKKIENSMMSKDLFNREMMQILHSEKKLKEGNFNKQRLINQLKIKFLEGQPIELVDGNNNTINSEILKLLFEAVEKDIKTTNQCSDKKFKFLPVAILGPQSTGKSTLINMLFGCDFNVSSGRCTKGMDISLKKSYYKGNYYYVLVMDTEGLLSIEKADESYDKRLTLLSMASAKKVIVNVNGEINIAMKKILTMSLFAGNKLNELCRKPEILFSLRNMADTNSDKMYEAFVKMEKELKDVAKINKVQLQQCIDFKGSESLILMRSAFNIETIYLTNDDKEILFEKMTTDKQFMQSIETLKEKIFCDADSPQVFSTNLQEWLNGCSSCWQAIQTNFDIFMIDSIKEIEDRNCLSQFIKQIKESDDYVNITEELSEIRITYEKQLKIPKNKINQIDKSCLDDIQKIVEFSKEKCVMEFNRKTEGYKNLQLVQEYIKILSQDIDFIGRKQEQLWQETFVTITNVNESNIKLGQLKISLKNFLLQQTPINESQKNQEIQKRKNKLDELYKKAIDEQIDQLNKILIQKQIPVVDLLKQILNDFHAFLKTLNVEDYPFQFSELNNVSQQYFSNLVNLQQIKTVNCAEKLQNYFLFNYIYAISETQPNNLGINIKKKKQDIEQTAFKKDVVKKEKKDDGFFNKLKTLFSDKKEIPENKLIKNENQYQISFSNEQIEIIQEYKVYLLSFLTNEESYYINNQEIIKNLHNICEDQNKQLSEKDIEFSVFYKSDLFTKFLFSKLIDLNIQRIFSVHNENIENFKQNAQQLKDSFDQLITDGINQHKIINETKECLNQNLCDYISKWYSDKVQSFLKQKSLDLTVESLNQNCYDAFGTEDEAQTLLFIENFQEYRKKLNIKIIQSLKQTIAEEYQQKIKNVIYDIHKKIQLKLDFLTCVFSDISKVLDERSDSEIQNLLAVIFNSVFMGDKEKYSKTLQDLLNKLKDKQDQINIINQITTDHLKNLQDDVFTRELNTKEPTLLQISDDPKNFIKSFIQSYTDTASFSEDLNISEQLDKKNTNQVYEKFKQSQYFKKIEQLPLEEYLIYSSCCKETCPFCNQPCQQRNGHTGKHNVSFHSFLAFKGIYEYDKQTQKQFVFDYCNSEINTQKFFRKALHNKNELTERISQYSLTTENLFFTLTWYNYHDLDLYVKCNCGTTIYYGNKTCDKCGTFLEIDMNAFGKCSNNPVEHIYLKQKPAANMRFEYWVKWYSFKDQNPSKNCEYLLQVCQEGDKSITQQRGVLNFDTNRESEHYIFFTKQVGIPFQEYMCQNYPQWTITASNKNFNEGWVDRQRKSWKLVGDKLMKKYDIPNNPPF